MILQRSDFKTEKAYLKFLDAQLQWWKDTQKEHDAAQADLEARRQRSGSYQGAEASDERYHRWYMKNVNRR